MKRMFDIFVALLGLTSLMPIYLIIMATVKINLGSPVLFKQARIGHKGNTINIYKFRTMTNERNKIGLLLPDKERITKLGKFLRSTSLDELISLWSVLKGDMSLVGPRPLLVEYLPLYSKEQSRRHEVKPGITGWAQVNGRNAISWDKKLELDVWYVNNQSLWLDIKILFYTFKKVITREGINTQDDTPMPKFRGSKK